MEQRIDRLEKNVSEFREEFRESVSSIAESNASIAKSMAEMVVEHKYTRESIDRAFKEIELTKTKQETFEKECRDNMKILSDKQTATDVKIDNHDMRIKWWAAGFAASAAILSPFIAPFLKAVAKVLGGGE